MLLSFCRYYSLERKLGPINKLWLDEVGYIITPEEKKMFLDLPKAEKEDFKDEFWERRDPDPLTEENEYKEMYYNRIEDANELFTGETRAGFLTDRGRIYILFGPPMDRLRASTNYEGKCQEIWYYGGFPVVFLDEFCTGKYILMTYDLSGIGSVNLQYMQDLNRAQAQAQQTIVSHSSFLNYAFDVEISVAQSNLIAGLVHLKIPLIEVWFKEKEGMMYTVIDLEIEIRDAEERLVWGHRDEIEIITNEDELQKDENLAYSTTIPFEIEEGIEGLQVGENRVFVTLTNTTGETSLRKVRVFTIK